MRYDLDAWATKMKDNIEGAINKKKEEKRKQKEEEEKSRTKKLEKILGPLLTEIPEAISVDQKEIKVMDLIREIDYNEPTGNIIQEHNLVGVAKEIFNLLKIKLKMEVELHKCTEPQPKYKFIMIVKNPEKQTI